MIVPVAPGRRLDLATACAGIGADGSVSPFAGLPQVHMARIEILDTLPAGGREPLQIALDPALLLFGLSFEGNLPHLARTMRDTMAPTCDAVFGCCAGYPGVAEPGFGAWLAAHEVPSQLPFAARTNGRREIEIALDRQARFRAFLPKASKLSPAELRAAFVEEFG